MEALQKLSMQFLVYLTRTKLDNEARKQFAEIFQLNKTIEVPSAFQEMQKGFNVLCNEICQEPLFENFIDHAEFQRSMKMSDFPRTVFKGNVYNSTKDWLRNYVVEMMKSDEFEISNYANIASKIRPLPQLDKPDEQFLFCEWDTRIVQLQLPSLSDMKLSANFKAEAEKLPDIYDFYDEDVKQKFSDFCRLFGTHFIESAFCGGSVQVGGYIGRVDADILGSLFDELYKLVDHWESKLSPAAATSQLGMFNLDINVSCLQSGHIEPSKLIDKTSEEMQTWRFNLPGNMVLLKKQMRLGQINELIKKAGFPIKAQAMSDALVAFLKDEKTVAELREKRRAEKEARDAQARIEKELKEMKEKRERELEEERLADERRKQEKAEKEAVRLAMEAKEREDLEKKEKEEEERLRTEKEEREKAWYVY